MPRKKLTLKEFIERSKKVHGNKYGYTKFVYINSKTSGIIDCPIHGEFSQIPNNHLVGKGCAKCSNNVNFNTEECIKRFKKIHGNKYDYSEFIYISAHIKGKIICKKHGQFFQEPNCHVHGRGCFKCANEIKSCTVQEFIEKTKLIHNNEYNYEKFVYVNSYTKGIIICKTHGEFLQAPNTHLNGQGCPKCGTYISKQEIEFLDYLQIPDTKENRQVLISRKKIDGLIGNIVYEFLGDYWHGNLEILDKNKFHPLIHITYEELNKKTFNRLNLIKSLGYEIKYIWENDWKKFKKGIDEIPKIQIL